MRNSSTLALTTVLGATAGAAQAESDPWALLSQIEIEEIVTETSYEVRKVFPAAIENGIEVFDITGYAVPLSPEGEVRELMLVADMGDCPFCGSSEHGGSLMVQLAEPLAGLEEGQRITLRGALEAVTDPETWQAAVMKGARLIRL